MTLRHAKLLLLCTTLVVSSGMAEAQQATNRPTAPTAVAPMSDLRKAMEQFNAKREATIAERQALLNQLKSATEQERKAILEKLQTQQKDMLEAQRALGKQIRDDMRKQREAARPGG